MRQSLIFAAGFAACLVSVLAVAGLNVDNQTLSLHRQNGGTTEVWFNLHHGALSIDTDSPTFGVGTLGALCTKAKTSQAAFDTEASGALDSWWGARDATERANFRQLVLDACD